MRRARTSGPSLATHCSNNEYVHRTGKQDKTNATLENERLFLMQIACQVRNKLIPTIPLRRSERDGAIIDTCTTHDTE